MLPKISIITPSYNQYEYIGQTIESVLNQGYPNLEYIVMDGGSTDGTLEVLKRYSTRLHWVSKSDRGQSHAINEGLRIATGEVISFLNSDDLFEPGALMKISRFFANNPEASWAAGKCRIVDHHGREIRKAISLYKNLWLRLNSRNALLVLNYTNQPGTFLRSEVVETVGYFDETLNYAMDYDYWLRVSQRFRLWALEVFLASFRVHPTSKGGTSVNDQFNEELEVAKRYVSNPIILGLHKLHQFMIVAIYTQLMARQDS